MAIQHSVASTEPTSLKTIGLTNPLGIESNPTFSWKIKSDTRGYEQSAYEIHVTSEDGTEVWSSGKVNSHRQTDIAYEGKNLKSRTKYNWSVTIYDKDGAASTTSTSSFETGILTQEEWNEAKWIGMKKSPYRAIVEIFPDNSNVSCQYLRMKVMASGPHSAADPNYGFVQIAEIEIYDNDGNNIAHDATFKASNAWELTNYGWSIKYINDGIIANGATNGFTTTQNSTATTITANLGSIKNISRIVLYPRQDSPAVGNSTIASNFPKTYSIEVSDDNKTYAPFYSIKNADAPSYESSNNVPYIGRTFNTAENKTIASARLYASALGVFTMKMNGKPVTLNVLEPGESAFDKHVLYSTYDVTDLVHAGQNTIIAQVAGGISNMSHMSDRFVKPELANNTASTSLRAMLYITYSDGTSQRLNTDGNWSCRKSPVTGSNWYGGEDYDALIATPEILTDGYDVSAWEKCDVFEHPTFCAPSVSRTAYEVGEMKAKEYEPLRVVKEWKAVSVTKNNAGNYLIDFGQNFAGTYEFTLKAPAGTKITLYDSELQENNACKFEYMYEPSGASNKTLDNYTFCGNAGGETWGPEFMYHGFRYLEIKGLTEAPDAKAFTAKMIRADVEEVGTFTTSNTLLNDIHRICANGIQSQIYNTITDCPHREKLGWLDVPNMMYTSLSYNFGVKSLLGKIVMDAFDSQGANGYVPSTVPHFMMAYDDDLNWGGAAITIPWRNFRQYGDKILMERYYEQMKKLIKYYSSLAQGGIIRNYSVLSDWGQNTCGLQNMTSSEFTLTCTYYYLLGAMSDMASALGHDDDAEEWKNTATTVKAAFNKRFFKNGIYEYGNQANYGMALYFDLVEEDNIQEVANKLAEAVKASGYSIKTGEIGLRPTLMSLAKYGFNDIVYKMSKKTDYPSYGYWIKNGATTSLEYWDMSLSQNHCMMDHIEEWFYAKLGGIENAGEAYDICNVAPWIPSDMKFADVSVQSPRGEIRITWNRTKSTTDYTLAIPAGCKANVRLPIVKSHRLLEEGKELAEIESIRDVVYKDSEVSFLCGSGQYTFTMDASSLEDEETGIESLSSGTFQRYSDPNNSKYNLLGVRANDDYRGIIVQNGKKLLNNK